MSNTVHLHRNRKASMIYVQSIVAKHIFNNRSRFCGMWGVPGISICMSRWRGPKHDRCLHIMYYHSWTLDWRFLRVFHYLSIFTQIYVVVPPEGMVIMKLPLLKLFLLIDSHPRVTYMFLWLFVAYLSPKKTLKFWCWHLGINLNLPSAPHRLTL